jgi:hypothetical protein
MPAQLSVSYTPSPHPIPSQQIKVVQLLPIPQHVPLDLTAVHPRDKILHAPTDQERRIRHHVRADAHMALLDKLDRRRHVLHHARPHHHDADPAPREARDRHFFLHRRQAGALAAALLDDANVVQLLQQRRLVLDAKGRVGRELRKQMGDLAQPAAERVVFAVVERVGQVVPPADGVFAVRGGAVGLVGDEVDLAQEP